jgi:hypothetical protein
MHPSFPPGKQTNMAMASPLSSFRFIQRTGKLYLFTTTYVEQPVSLGSAGAHTQTGGSRQQQDAYVGKKAEWEKEERITDDMESDLHKHSEKERMQNALNEQRPTPKRLRNPNSNRTTGHLSTPILSSSFSRSFLSLFFRLDCTTTAASEVAAVLV